MSKKINITFIVILSILFIVEIIIVKTNLITPLDIKIYNFITNVLSDGPIPVFKVITFLGDEIFLIILCILLILKYEKGRGVAFTFILFLSTMLNHILKLLIRRPRPEYMQLVIEKSFSFPSGHSMAICTVVGVIIYFIWHSKLKRSHQITFSILLSIIALLVMFSRIYLGAHYLSDVLGGLTCSLLFLNIIYYYYKFYLKASYFLK